MTSTTETGRPTQPGAEHADSVLLDSHRRALTDPETAELVVSPPEGGPGSWAGAPSAILVDGTFFLGYRLRRPIGQGRGYANVIARSSDGVTFETVAVFDKKQFGADSLERPALAVTADGQWRAYLSPNTPGTDHWRVDLLEASTPEALPAARPRTVLAGSADLAVKDPVILRAGAGWHLWASCHPLTDAASTDRMTTEYATSADGVEWVWQGTALAGRPRHWDARGVRISAVRLDGVAPLAYYDGRATAAENWEERTGLAVAAADLGDFRALGDEPIGASPSGGRGLRYVSVVPLGDGRSRYYFELTRADGAHELRTRLVTDLPV